MRSVVSKAYLPEESLLSILLTGESNLVDVVVDLGLRAEMFAKEECAEVYRALCQAAALGDSGEAAVFDLLKDRSAEVRALLNSLIGDATPGSRLEVKPLAKEIMGRWRRRQIDGSAKLIQLKIADIQKNPEEEPWSATKETIEPLLEKMVDTLNDVQKEVSLAQQVDSAKAQLVERLSGAAGKAGLSTGFPEFDTRAYKIRQFELWIIAGGTSAGKTALVCNIVSFLEAAGVDGAFFTLEMGAEELIERLGNIRSGISYADAGKHPANRDELFGAMDVLRESSHLRIYDDLTALDQITAKCRLLKSAGKLSYVVIDYLQLIEPPKAVMKERRDVQVGVISRRLKAMARTLKVPVIALSQFNRDFQKEGRPPRLWDLRESGSLEQDADRVWLLFVPAEKKVGTPQTDEDDTVEVMVDQAKCRGGPRPSARLVFKRPTSTFSWYVEPQAESQGGFEGV